MKNNHIKIDSNIKNNNNQKKSFGLIKKFFNYIWNGESFLSWILFMAIVFIVIKFIFFPLLSFVTGTSLPIVIVESCSMYHDTSFDNWWQDNGEWYEKNGITKTEFRSFALKNGFSKGDIFIILGTKKGGINVGDTIIFSSGNYQRPIIHRVISINPLSTKGDNNPLQFTSSNNPEGLNEVGINESEIIGKATPLRIPYLGWVKLIFYEPFRHSSDRGFCR